MEAISSERSDCAACPLARCWVASKKKCGESVLSCERAVRLCFECLRAYMNMRESARVNACRECGDKSTSTISCLFSTHL